MPKCKIRTSAWVFSGTFPYFLNPFQRTPLEGCTVLTRCLSKNCRTTELSFIFTLTEWTKMTNKETIFDKLRRALYNCLFLHLKIMPVFISKD